MSLIKCFLERKKEQKRKKKVKKMCLKNKEENDGERMKEEWGRKRKKEY